MLAYADRTTVQELKDYTINVSEQAISEIFRTKLKFSANCLMHYLDKKIKKSRI